MTNKVFFSKTLFPAVKNVEKCGHMLINISVCADSEYEYDALDICVECIYIFKYKAKVLLRCVTFY